MGSRTEYNQVYKAAHRDRIREYNRTYYLAHREERIAVARLRKAQRRDAIRAQARARYRANRERILQYHREHRRERDTGVSPALFQEMLERQRGLCAICEGPLGKRQVHADHDHGTGRPRGLLHAQCNTGIGLLGDDPARLRRAADYIERARSR